MVEQLLLRGLRRPSKILFVGSPLGHWHPSQLRRLVDGEEHHVVLRSDIRDDERLGPSFPARTPAAHWRSFRRTRAKALVRPEESSSVARSRGSSPSSI